MNSPARRVYVVLAVVILTNTLLWLDSLEHYLGARYHVSVGAYLPEVAFVPSRAIGRLSGAPAEETAGVTPRDVPPPPSAVPVPASALVSTVLEPSPLASGVVVAQEAALAGPRAPRVLFAGDSLMQGLAPIAISQLRKAYPDGYFSDQSKQSTGLTMRRYFDWPLKIRNEIDKQKFDTVVIFLGPNDPWDILEDGKRYRFASDDWIEKYRSRVVEVLEFSKANDVSVVWIGLPNMRDDRLRRGAMLENQVFREETERFGFHFIPTEQIVGRLDEPFRRYVEDPAKGKVAVRAEDGVHMTPAGSRLITGSLLDLLKMRWQ